MIDKILPGVAAIDIGQEALFVAVADAPVQRFGTFTAEIRRLGAYLQEQGVCRVAMEATGVYWIPLHDHLDQSGFEVTVFHGAHARNLPGRKTDVADCQWHAMLHSHGLLSPCFIPPPQIRELRTFYRLREDHVGLAAMHIQHMQKALDLMNVRLHNVISQIQGVSGLRVIEAILAGERDAAKLVELCDRQILKHKRDEVIASLEGNWEAHHLFALRQALEGYRFYRQQMVACDHEIEQLLHRLTAEREPQEPHEPHEPKTRKTVRHNAPEIKGLHGQLVDLCEGRDATVLPGVSPLSFMKLIGELGSDLSAWPSEKHFTSWLGLAPGRHESGKRRRRVARRKTVAGQIFREAALSLTRSKYLALGAFYRRIKGRKGAAVALTAVARKLAELYYRAMTKGLDYAERGVQQYEEAYRQQTVRYVEKMARQLGLAVIANVPTEAAGG